MWWRTSFETDATLCTLLDVLAVELHPLQPADAHLVASWALDPRFRAAAEWTERPLAEHVAFQSRLIADPPADLVRLGAFHRGEPIGYVVLQGAEPLRRELGFVIGDSRRWGLGLGRQAARAGLDYAFAAMGLTEVWAEALAANVASVRILQGLGMTELEPGERGTYLGRLSRFRRFAIHASSPHRHTDAGTSHEFDTPADHRSASVHPRAHQRVQEG